MYADGVLGDRWGASSNAAATARAPGVRRQERYERQIDELDYIVPRGGYYFEVRLAEAQGFMDGALS
jgi:hypothetical protein